MSQAARSESTAGASRTSLFLGDDDHIGCVLHGILAYRQEVRIYPEGHPRLEERSASVHQRLSTLTAEVGTIVWGVSGETLASVDGPLEVREDLARETATLMRERMVQSIRIDPGMTRESVERFAALLSQPPATVDLAEINAELEGLTLISFHDQFTADMLTTEIHIPVSEAPDVDPAAVDSELFLPTRGAHAGWDRFESSEMELINKVLDQVEVTAELDRLLDELPDPDLEQPFLQQLFGLIRRERTGDWTAPDVLSCAVKESVEELLEACQEARTAGGVPFNRIAAGADRLSTNLRWQLLKSLVGWEASDHPPRESADLSCLGDDSEPAPNPVAPIPPSRIEDDLTSSPLLAQYARTMSHLALLRESEGESIQMALFDFIREQIDVEDPGPFIRILLETVSVFPGEAGLSWLADAFHELIPPHRVLPALQEFEDEMGAPSEVSGASNPNAPNEDRFVAPGLLERLVSPRDRYALDLALQGVLRATGDGERRWLNVFRRVLGSQDAPNWLRHNSRRFFTGRGLRALFELPPEIIVQEIKRNYRDCPEKVVKILKDMTQFSRMETTFAIGHIMEKREPRLLPVALEFISERPFPEMLTHLEQLIESASESQVPDDLAVLACRALGTMNDAPACELLERVQKEKTLLGYRWKKRIRKAAADAMKVDAS